MTTWDLTRLPVITELSTDGAAMNEAALAGDLDEAWFRAVRIQHAGAEADLQEIAVAAQRIAATE